MTNYVIALSGAIGSGKSSLASKLVEHLGAERVSFGDEVRAYATKHGQDPKDRSVLQQLGQALVMTELSEFVRRVLMQAPDQLREGDAKKPLIIDGVRHVEALFELRNQLKRTVHLVHIQTTTALRERWLMERYEIERRLIARYDADISEAQVERILPQYAEFTIDGDLPAELQIKRIDQAVAQWVGKRALEPA